MSKDIVHETDVYRVLYKMDNTPGWYYGEAYGSCKEVETLCEKLQRERNWYTYEYHHDGKWRRNLNQVEFMEVAPTDDDLHMRTSLIHNIWNNKYYFPDEIMPYPEHCSKRSTSKFAIKVEEDEDEIDENWFNPDKVEVVIKFGMYKPVEILAIANWVLEDIPDFISDLQNNGYANLSIEEHWYHKFLAWQVGSKVRFVIQCTGHERAKVVMNKLMSAKLFYSEFDKLSKDLKCYIDKHTEEFNKKQ